MSSSILTKFKSSPSFSFRAKFTSTYLIQLSPPNQYQSLTPTVSQSILALKTQQKPSQDCLCKIFAQNFLWSGFRKVARAWTVLN